MSEAAQPAAAPQTPANGAAAAEGGGEQTWEQIKETVVADSEKADAADKAKAAKDASQQKPKDGEPPKERKPKFSEWQAYEHKQKKLNEDRRAFEEVRAKGQRDADAIVKRTAELDERAKVLDRIETDPKAFIEHFAKKLNMSPAKVLNALNDHFLEQKSPAELEVAKLRQEMTEKEKREAEAKKKADEDAAKQADTAKVRGYVAKIADYVTAKADDFTYISTYPPQDVAATAWARIQQHYDRTGESVPLDKILGILESEEEAMFLKKEERRKLRQSVGAQKDGSPNREGAAQAANHDAQQRPTTLNHRLAGQRTPQARGQSDPEDWEEAKRQAGVVR